MKTSPDRYTRRITALLGALTLLAAACAPPAPAPPPPPKVVVAHPLDREVAEWDEYTARFEATDYVEVRARVSGYLEKVHFTDGATVEAGTLLFTIDPRPYEAVRRRAEGDLAVAKARLDLARKRLERADSLVSRNAISREEADTRAAEARQAEAAVLASQAALDAAKLDVEFTQVRAPIAGRVGRKLVTEGNLVNGGSGTQGTLLTTVVSLDPMYVYFDADERAFLKYQRLAQLGERPGWRDTRIPVEIALADEESFPHQGYVDFVDNQLDAGTGTMIFRAVVANPYRQFTPGLFARLRLPGRGRYRALLIPDEAVVTDQARKLVYVVDDQGVAQGRPVALGSVFEGMRIVREGLRPSDRVVVSGVQRVKPGERVQLEEKILTVAKGAPAAAASPAAFVEDAQP
ncbi:MAG: efflux RND transporter periplasmic adaptor subunit [Thermodesulfobacteriota bacterium]